MSVNFQLTFLLMWIVYSLLAKGLLFIIRLAYLNHLFHGPWPCHLPMNLALMQVLGAFHLVGLNLRSICYFHLKQVIILVGASVTNFRIPPCMHHYWLMLQTHPMFLQIQYLVLVSMMAILMYVQLNS